MARQPDVTLPLRHCKMARPVDKLSGKHNLPIWRERMGRERKNEIKQRAEQNLLFVRRFPVPTSTIYPHTDPSNLPYPRHYNQNCPSLFCTLPSYPSSYRPLAFSGTFFPPQTAADRENGGDGAGFVPRSGGFFVWVA